ncbi:hypothetical protein EW026_g7278 [Hermanssonia centrifuga]|uniref:[histone H3]-lysine(36) N-trimethyltransferase n=1 Tax=Hermanssonia centrifuga TaxID=98765 RepID=A0A4V3X9G8_9APHY|nr:hypothetical protein EW026_g7278 [Hermanssonia centrifuga]
MLQKDEVSAATSAVHTGILLPPSLLMQPNVEELDVFANHSCKPNCYVAKWTIGNKVRMGIFAHRNIQKYEELTFNYNVDRYGHDAQPCYCGEAKCVGFIGGKTQTDLAAMDDLYLDALGITDEVEQLGLKGSKKKRSKKLDEDFIPDLKPLLLKDVPKVVQAMRQTQSRKVLVKLLTRIKLTEDQSALRQIMRLRGFSVMTNILEDYAKDIETCVLALECMMTWPLIQRNKVEDSKVNVPVKVCSESDNQVLAELAKKLLEQWETLEFAYRIPKRQKTDGNEDDPQDTSPVEVVEEEDWRPSKRSKRSGTPEDAFTWAPAPMSSERLAELDRIAEQTRASEALMRKAREDKEARERDSFKKQKDDIAAIIAAATAATEAAALAPAVPSPSGDHRSNGSHKKRSSKSKKLSAEEKEANKEKRLLKLVGAVVVKVMSKYQKEMDSDSFKRHAKELTQVIAEKEKKTSSYKDSRLDALSDEKVAKIKKFAKEYIAKILRKLDKAGQRHKSSSSAPSSSMSASTSTAHMSSNGHSHANDLHDVDIPTAMDSMDLDDRWDDGWGEPSPMGESHRSSPTTPKHVVDPRVRHRKEESGWDPSYDSKDTFTGVQPYEEDAFDDDLRLR